LARYKLITYLLRRRILAYAPTEAKSDEMALYSSQETGLGLLDRPGGQQVLGVEWLWQRYASFTSVAMPFCHTKYAASPLLVS